MYYLYIYVFIFIFCENKGDRLNKEIMIAFVDAEKTFDNINWNIMLKVLRDVKVDYMNRRIVLQLYKNQRALIS